MPLLDNYFPVDSLRIALVVLIAIQAIVMLIDERFFHRRRGLGTFERWGHVADTLAFGGALLVPAFLMPSASNTLLYFGLAVFSTILITKDEWVHAGVCSGAEQWCHAVLFILHGLLLTLVGLIWIKDPESPELSFMPIPVILWAFYQFFYWNVYHVRSRNQ